jgi:succinoglycan biosynthesis protein ExoM
MKDFISVCVATFQRIEMLEHLIRNLAMQTTYDCFDFSVIVVDNDANGSAREKVMQLKADLGLDITYEIEPIRTIPAARNHALRLARGNFIGIIDDDEFPPQDWLLTLYRAILGFGADGALGPVHPFFEQIPPKWLLKGGFCERPVIRTGTLLLYKQTRTGNVLLKKEVFDKHNLCFDEKYTTGGSDQAFFKEAMKRGCRFVAVAEAPVYEIVGPERWTKCYYLKRALINGYNAHSYSRQQGLGYAVVLLKSLIALIGYLVALPIFALMGSHTLMKFLERGAHHLSRLLAMFGIKLVKKRYC